MKTGTRLVWLGMLLLAPSGCGDNVTNEYFAVGGGESESGGSGTASGGATSAKATGSQSGGEDSGEGGALTSGTNQSVGSVADTVACVPGASVSCACDDGTSSAQVCSDDGKSFGECKCGTVPVDGYSGTCVLIGDASAFCEPTSGSFHFVWVNCGESPASGYCEATAITGVWCCADKSYWGT